MGMKMNACAIYEEWVIWRIKYVRVENRLEEEVLEQKKEEEEALDANTDYKDIRSVLRKFITGEAFSNIYRYKYKNSLFIFFFLFVSESYTLQTRQTTLSALGYSPENNS